MPIKRCTKQSRKTLEEFYNFLSEENPAYNKVRDQMLAFINLVNDLFEKTLIGLPLSTPDWYYKPRMIRLPNGM